MTNTLDQLLDPAMLEDLASQPLDEVRANRDECQRAEHGLSYVRRLAQGRLDIVGRELEHRRTGDDAGDLSSLVEELPQILADRMRGPGLGRPPQDLEPHELPDELLAELDAIAGPSRLGAMADADVADLEALVTDLEAFEQKVSGLRRQLHGQIDALQAEITRRYRTGEASVESLLA
jgi:hypothetical protein